MNEFYGMQIIPQLNCVYIHVYIEDIYIIYITYVYIIYVLYIIRIHICIIYVYIKRFI